MNLVFETGPIFNAVACNNVSSWRECKTPFTFEYKVNGVPFVHKHGKSSQCGYASESEAAAAAADLIFMLPDLLEKCVWVVHRNADMNAGDGPMIIDKIFRNPKDAHDYIMSRTGVQGRAVSNDRRFGVNINGELYGGYEYTDHTIRAVELN